MAATPVRNVTGCPYNGGRTNGAIIAVKSTATDIAGNKRQNRVAMKPRKVEKSARAVSLATNSPVMKKPETTKNTSTPAKPPGTGRSAW